MSPIFPLLGLVLRSDAYGYELKRFVESEFDPHWRIDFAQLYRSLAKLDAQGFVRTQNVAGESGPARKIYRATASGRRAFEQWLEQPATAHDEFWVKMRLATTLGYDATALVHAERARTETERTARRANQLQARTTRDAGKIVSADAALRRVQAEADALAFAESVIFNGAHSEKRDANAPLLILGSDDPLLAYLAQDTHVVSQVMGSTAGLVALASEQADIAGTHLREPEVDEYNISYVQHLVPEQDILLVNLAQREYGFLVARGNPKNIRGVRDLTRRNVRLMNRTRGAGARLWLHQHFRRARIDPATLTGWLNTAATYDALAAAIEAGAADVGPGLRITAEQWNLEFISLGQERFDLAIPRALYESPRGAKFFERMHSQAFRAHASSLPGYDISYGGRVVAEIKFGRAISRKFAA